MRYVVCLIAISILIGGVTAASEQPVTLRWALGAWSGDGAAPEAILKDTALGAGTRLKFLVEPMAPSTVYLLLQDSDRAIHVLYHESPVFKPNAEGEPTYIPPGSQYFELDDAAGVDTFFLLASAEPLSDLEDLLSRYESAQDESERAKLADEIIAEIRRQHKAHRNFAKPVEKPILIGGQTRGDAGSITEAIDRLATEVSSGGFYSKTITIDHE